MNNRKLAEITTCDDDDCTKTGHTVALYADGRVSATYHTRWQGSRDGCRHVLHSAVDVSKIDSRDQNQDAEAVLTAAWDNHLAESLDGQEFTGSGPWTMTQSGHIVE
jgi:hypothetical protein